MNKQDSAKTVFLALSVNFFIGLIKSFVAIFTSSSAMFSEAVHSFVDSFNQFLLWFGIKQAKKDKPLIYPLGRGSCLLYTSPSPRDKRQSRMPSSA